MKSRDGRYKNQQFKKIHFLHNCMVEVNNLRTVKLEKNLTKVVLKRKAYLDITAKHSLYEEQQKTVKIFVIYR